MSLPNVAIFPSATRDHAGLKASPVYYPALDGVRTFCVFFVILYHVVKLPSLLTYFEGWLGVDIFFVLSGFLITGLLLREKQLTGGVDLTSFYIRRAFRILPIYYLVLSIYVVGLQRASEFDKWTKMKVALPYFLTFNNDIPFVIMPDRVGTVFGLSWTLGVEEKFYLFWPLICFILLSTRGKRLVAGWAVYGATLLLALFSFKLSWAYSGLIVGAILAMMLSAPALAQAKRIVSAVPASVVLGLVILGFALVAFNEKYVYAFSWIAGLMVASLTIKETWLSKCLSTPILVWLGKRSYAMYLIQGFAIDGTKIFLKPRNTFQEVVATVGAFALAAMGSAALHVLVEEPARRLGKKIIAHRKSRQSIRHTAELLVGEVGPT
jgi:peptidoglycan/LPS O-acetylase OafA/YrhL